MDQLELPSWDLSLELRAGTFKQWLELAFLSAYQSPQLHSLVINSAFALANQKPILSLCYVQFVTG